MELGKELERARKESGVTQKELAKMIGLNQTRISEYEVGKRKPKLEMLIKIAKALGVRIYIDMDKEELLFVEGK